MAWCAPLPRWQAQRVGARGRNRISDPGRVSLGRCSDLSGLAGGLAEPARDRRQDRGGFAGRHPHCDRGPDRLGGAGLLPPPQARLHDVLYDALSGIYRGALHHSGGVELCGAAALSCGGRHDDGGDRFALSRTQRARFPQARLLGARRRYRSLQSGSSGRARFAASHLHDDGPRRRRKEYRSVSFARPAGVEGRGRRWTAKGGTRSTNIPRSNFWAKRPARI